MLKINISPDSTFNIRTENQQLFINDQPFQWDLLQTSDRAFHVLKDGVSYRAEVVQADFENKLFVLKVNGNTYQIRVQDQLDLLLEKMGMADAGATVVTDIKAPMPGLILDIKVTEGQEVKKGEVILILEAMKMENAIKSPADGTIRTIKIKRGDSVEKNQVLILF
jgi:acetyl/propionyl-CoA carboxylase alpha subunit